jgi:hypothetical protein
MFKSTTLSILATLSLVGGGLVTSALVALIFHYLWPHSIPTMYPSLVVKGYIPAEVSWLTAFATCEVVTIIRLTLWGK